jgi:hypothetical protein
MTRRLLTATAVLFASILAAPRIGHAQTFKVEKFDIKGDGGTGTGLPPGWTMGFQATVSGPVSASALATAACQ